MPRRVNKPAVAIVTVAVMAMSIFAGVLLVKSIPSADPLPMARKAEAAIAQGDYRLALQCYQYAYQRSQEAKWLVKAADTARDMGESNAAFALWQKAVQKDPNCLEARQNSLAFWMELLEMKDWRLSTGEANDIAENAEVLLKSQKDDFVGRFARGVAYINQRVEKPQLESKGLDDLNKALELNPTDMRVQTVLRSYWLAKNQPEKAEAICQDMIKKMPEEPTGYLALGQLWLTQEKIDPAVEQLKKAVSLAKGAPQPAVTLAQGYASKREFEAADKLLVQTIQTHPDFYDAYLQRAIQLQMANKPGEALTLAEEWLKRPAILVGYKASRNRMERLQMYLQAASAAIAGAGSKSETDPDKELLKKAETYVKATEKEAGQATPFTDLLWGRIHRLNGSIVEATKSLEKADKGFNPPNPDVRLRLAEVYLLQKELGLAQKMLASVIQLAPKYARAYYMAAVVAAQLNDVTDAMNKIDTGLSLEPDNREMLQLKGTLLQAVGKPYAAIEEKLGKPTSASEQLQRATQKMADKKPQEAEAIYREVLASDPTNLTALRMLLAMLLQSDRVKEAREVYEAARIKAPDNPQVRQMELAFTGDMTPEQRDQKILEVIRSETDEYARNSQLYVFYVGRQKFDEAQKIVDEMEKTKPDDERVVSMQFGLALVKKDWPRAQKCVEVAARKDLDGAEGGFFRARLLAAKGDLVKCQDELNLALGKYPSFSDGWIQMAEVFYKLNRLEDARKALTHALELNPTKGEGYKGLAQIAMAQGDSVAFEQNVLKAAQYLSDDPWVSDQWMTLKEQKDPKGAIELRRKMLDARPNDVTNMVRLALLLERDGKYDEATKLIERGQKILPKDESLAWLAANYWQRRGDSAKAEKILLDLAAAVDDDAKAQVSQLLGRLYQTQGLTEKAEQTYVVATKQAPQVPGPQVELAAFYRGSARIDDAVKAYRAALQAEKKTKQDEATIRQQLIEMLLQSRKLDEVSKEIDAYHVALPDDPMYQLLRGTMLMLQGKTEEAINTLNGYLQRDPNNAPARFHRGLLYMATNRLREAIDDLSLAKQVSPNGFNFEHRTALAQAYEVNGESQRGVTELNEILSSNPQALNVARLLANMYQRAGRKSDMEVLIRKYMVDVAPQDPTWAQMLGQFGEMTGDYSKAVEGYLAAAKVSQFRLDMVDDLLRMQISAKRYDDAISTVNKVIPEASRTGVVKARLAQALFQQGSQDKARPLFIEAVAESSKDYVTSLLVARIASDTLGQQAATELLQQRMTAEPENLVIKYMLVSMLGEMQQWDPAEKLSAEALAAAKSDEDKVLILRQRGGLLYQAGKHEAASKAYEEQLKLSPKDGEAMNNVAYILAEDLSRPAEALRYAKRAVELRPRDANVIDTLGWVYYLAGDLDSAVGTLVSALQVSPNNIAARYHVAMAYKKQGKMDLANRELAAAQQAIEKAPKDPIAAMFQDRVKKELSGLSGAAGK